MREVVLRVPRISVEDVLDRLLPIVPGGVREVSDGRYVQLRMRGPDLPSLVVLERAVGHWSHRLGEHLVPDDWRERRMADYEEDVIGGRLVVRAQWAPAPRDGLIDIVLRESPAFGSGTHPTTRACLELMLGLEPAGPFADLGCGTGVLAIAAAKLGWTPVAALDLLPGSVEATLANAAANSVHVEARTADLTARPPPAAPRCPAPPAG